MLKGQRRRETGGCLAGLAEKQYIWCRTEARLVVAVWRASGERGTKAELVAIKATVATDSEP